jgi:glycine betaine/proline transport system substrate-binding protein
MSEIKSRSTGHRKPIATRLPYAPGFQTVLQDVSPRETDLVFFKLIAETVLEKLRMSSFRPARNPSRLTFLLPLLLAASLLVPVLQGCSEEGKPDPDRQHTGERSPVRIVYVDWASEKASSNVVKAVIEERLHRECELLPVTLVAMWESLAAGDQDGSVAAWLPLQARYLKKHRSEVVNLGPNLEGTRIGLVVPDYVDIDSIGELKEHAGRLGNKIIGIDPHAGLMEETEKAIHAYDLKKFKLVSGSGPTMTEALRNAIEERRWIVVTGWTPHWKFAEWDLHYLDDPKNVYGEEEHISTIARKGLKRDMPEVFDFLNAFYWHPGQMEQVMLMARDEQTTYYEAAKRWIGNNEKVVEQWVKQK